MFSIVGLPLPLPATRNTMMMRPRQWDRDSDLDLFLSQLPQGMCIRPGTGSRSRSRSMDIRDMMLPRLAEQLLGLSPDADAPDADAPDAESEVKETDKEFRIRLDLRNFAPEDVKITAEDGRISVHAKHEEKQDKNGYVWREVIRSFQLPENLDDASASSSMNSDGILNIKFPKCAIEAPKEVQIPMEIKSSDLPESESSLPTETKSASSDESTS